MAVAPTAAARRGAVDVLRRPASAPCGPARNTPDSHMTSSERVCAVAIATAWMLEVAQRPAVAAHGLHAAELASCLRAGDRSSTRSRAGADRPSVSERPTRRVGLREVRPAWRRSSSLVRRRRDSVTREGVACASSASRAATSAQLAGGGGGDSAGYGSRELSWSERRTHNPEVGGSKPHSASRVTRVPLHFCGSGAVRQPARHSNYDLTTLGSKHGKDRSQSCDHARLHRVQAAQLPDEQIEAEHARPGRVQEVLPLVRLHTPHRETRSMAR